jgi:hypothetical protein
MTRALLCLGIALAALVIAANVGWLLSNLARG